MKATEEIWKAIAGFPNHMVSSLGRIKSNDMVVTRCVRGKKHTMKRSGKILSTKKTLNNSGYIFRPLTSSGKTIGDHRVVAETFLGNPGKGFTVNHKNGIKTDNRLCNLEWITYKQNAIHSRTFLKKRGKIFTVDDVIEIIKRAHYGERVKELSEKYSCARQAISSILSGRTWWSEDYPMVLATRKKYPYKSPVFGTKHNRY